MDSSSSPGKMKREFVSVVDRHERQAGKETIRLKVERQGVNAYKKREEEIERESSSSLPRERHGVTF